MGSIYRKTVARALPKTAKKFKKAGEWFAKWNGKTYRMNDKGQMLVKVQTYTAKIGTREIATGCRDKAAARQVLAREMRKAELKKSGLLTESECSAADHLAAPFSEHVKAFIRHLKTKGVHAIRVKNTESRLDRLAEDCKFSTLADLKRDALVNWLSEHDSMSAGNLNEFRQTLIGFCNWCVRPSVGRLVANPFADVPKVKGDKSRNRRAMTEAELGKLLLTARGRPLAEALTIRRGPRKGQLAAKIKDEVRERLEREGLERALIYKTLLLTGLRKNELATLTIGQLYLDEGFLGPVSNLVSASREAVALTALF
jgi:hypothetical protein